MADHHPFGGLFTDLSFSTIIDLGQSTLATLSGSDTSTSGVLASTTAAASTIAVQSTSSLAAVSTTLDTSVISPTSVRSPTSIIIPYSSSLKDPTSSSPTDGAATKLPSELPNSHEGDRDNPMSRGALAAAIAVPILFVLFVLLLIGLVCLRRKSKLKKKSTEEHVNAPQQMARPTITANENHTYFTGLDTPSHDSQHVEPIEDYAPVRRSEGGTFFEPPPPYKAHLSASPPSSGGLRTDPDLEDLAHWAPVTTEEGALAPLTVEGPRDESPFIDPPSPISPISTNVLESPDYWGAYNSTSDLVPNSHERPTTSRSNTNRSITSTLYSDNASIHSAQAQRISVTADALPPPDGQRRHGSYPLDNRGGPKGPCAAESYR